MPIEQELKYFRYRYIPKEFSLMLDKPYEFRDNTVTYMNIIFDYINNRIPIIQVGIECDNVTIAQIYKHKDIAKMTITIDEQREDPEDNRVLDNRPYIKGTFTLIPALDQTAYITDTDLDVDERTDNAKMLQMFEFYLTDLEKVNWFDAKRNFNVQNTSLPAMFQALFYTRHIPGNLIVASPPMQDIKVPKVVLPLGTLIGNIRALNSKYGLYDCNPIVFWDLTYLYCLNKREPNTQMEDTETDFGTVTFTLNDPDDQHHLIRGSFDDPETSTHYINLEGPPHIRDESYQDVHTKTSTLITVNKDGTVDQETTLDGDATKATYVYVENALSKAQVINEMITGPTIDISAKDISVKCLRPYKDYNFRCGTTYENLHLDGKTFRLLQYTLGIRREGSSNYISDIGLVLYCPKRDTWEEETTDEEETTTP